jgi:peptidyl-tRNA hydrolase, PTH1 family
VSVDAVVVGLGNPGKKYERTRHNVGEECVRELARRAGVELKSGRDNALKAEATLRDRKVVLAFPITYMNESGQAVRAILKRHGMDDPEHLIVVHEELDLPPATVRIKVGGGLAGHNGLRSISSHLHTQDFVRVRIGVGKPPSKEQGGDHVLSKMPPAMRKEMDVAIQEAADAVEVILADGPEAAMRQYHAPR